MLALHHRVLMISTLGRVQPEGVALALVVWAAAQHRPGLAGTLIACTTFPQLVTGPIMGRAIDRSRNPDRLVALAASASAASCGALAASALRPAPSIVAALVLACSTPVLTGGVSSVVMGWSDDHPTLAAWDSTGYNIAGLGAPVIVTLSAARHPHLALWSLGATSLILAALLLRTRPASAASRAGEPGFAEPPARIRDALAAIVRSRPLRAVTVATTVLSAGLGGLELALASAVASRGLTVDRVGVLVTVSAAGALAGSLALTRRSLPSPPATTALVAVAVTGGIVLTLAAAPWWLMVGLAAAIGLAGAPLLVAVYRTRTDHSPPSTRASVFTISASAKLGASSLGAVALGAIVSRGPSDAGLAVVGGVGLLGAALGVTQLRRIGPTPRPTDPPHINSPNPGEASG